MHSATRLSFASKFAGIAVFLFWSSAFPTPAKAQGTQGQNAVCPSNSTCLTSNTVGTNAFIDASMFGSKNTDFCSALNFILNVNNHIITSAGAVIDARGLPGTTGTNMTCSSSPWGSGINYLTVPSTILLPAGTIVASAPWVLPANTKLIGVAKGTGADYILETTIRANFSSGAVVEFGDSTHCSFGCQGISIEHLTINGNGYAVNGIQNDNCGLLCYADHITMYQVLGTGLEVSGANATDSGPYSDITFDVGGTPDPSTQCAQIIGAARAELPLEIFTGGHRDKIIFASSHDGSPHSQVLS